MLPSILNQLPSESLAHLKERIVGGAGGAGQGAGGLLSSAAAGGLPSTAEEDDDVPDLVDNFDEPSKKEAPTVEAKPAESTDSAPAPPKTEE